MFFRSCGQDSWLLVASGTVALAIGCLDPSPDPWPVDSAEPVEPQVGAPPSPAEPPRGTTMGMADRAGDSEAPEEAPTEARGLPADSGPADAGCEASGSRADAGPRASSPAEDGVAP